MAADELADEDRRPGGVGNYGGFGTTTIFGERMQDSLRLIGRLLAIAKAQAAVDFILSAREDLDNRTKGISDADKPSVYVGGLGAEGRMASRALRGQYALLDVIHARNVVDETGQ